MAQSQNMAFSDKLVMPMGRAEAEALPFVSSDDIGHLDDSVLRERVATERMRQYMSRQRLTALSVFLPASYLLWMHLDRVSVKLLVAWWLCLVFVDMISVWHTTWYLSAQHSIKSRAAWRVRQILLETLAGVIWGSTVYLFQADIAGELDRAIILTTISAVAVIGLLHYRQAVISFTVGLWSIPLLVYFTDGNAHHMQLAAGIIVLVVSLNFYLWEASRQLVDGIEQRFCADALAQALRSAATRIHELSTHDELTGIFNRRYGMQALKQSMGNRRKANEDQHLGLMLMDIDHFKQVNDMHGHPAGDEVLRQISRQLQQGMRTSDVVSRVGGEEFMVVLPMTTCDEAEVLAQRLCDAIAATPVALASTTLSVSISIGVTEVSEGENLEQALSRVDVALYEAKRGGRNRVVRAQMS